MVARKSQGGVINSYTLMGVPYRDEIEDNIRQNYLIWLAAGAAVESERLILQKAWERLADKLREGGELDA